ncbi:hypothetical protein AVEN_101425-1 [Araneus ventricosus]|uniref:Uncharacterized protein n=1 Tax=Araneus ventricosus TaxID=182803 RepID=A0A4Y2CUZ4_ARAVE|nr:hypothetical protein AVEN_101425-1 [Araneus ventricosus]
MAVLSTSGSISVNIALKYLKLCSLKIWQDRWNLLETGRRAFLYLPQVNINRASFNSKINQFITRHGAFVTYLHGFCLCSHDRCVCGYKGNPNHYATVFPVTKPFHFKKPSAENLSAWCENIVQSKRSLARLMNIMKILHEQKHDIIMD